jgi:1-acyl-sn-glycerol-3-phosphate acyltransferase
MPFPGLSGRLFYHAMLLPYFSVFTLGFGTRVGGKHNVPQSGPALLLANHQSYLDPMLLGIAAYPRRLTFLARKELFNNRLFGPFIRWCGAIPIDQGFGRDGLRAISSRLDAGEAVVIFPEGERTIDGSMLPLKPGISLLLRHAKWSIIPTGIAGAHAAWPRTRMLPQPSPLFLPKSPRNLAVHFGEPIASEEYSHWSRDCVVEQIAERIQHSYDLAEDYRRVVRNTNIQNGVCHGHDC